MKYFVLLTGLILACYLLGFIKKSEKYQWMDRNYTTAIKGFSILTVVWAHSGAMLSVGGIQFVAGIGVALFLMCSGYGLEISYEKNGLEEFWKKRLLSVCLPFWVVELVGLFATATFTIKTYLFDFCCLKGFDIVLKAAEKIGKSVDFYIIGGEPSAENKKYKEAHNLSNVHFVDFLGKDELREYYNAADLFVLMTRGDTWGLVINEAMANGLPVITTKRCVAGVELIKDGENGYIIEVDDTEALVNKVLTLRDNEELCRQMSLANINKMQTNTIDQIAKNHIQVLESFFKEKKQ
ncbi:MAG: hypothetical protein DBY37_11925 [Desulfovibrionaceae bacterium]|nr:MAG: hypothetical protein DBY37_11925 [Desulfovibrionaceae bacterium]